VVYWQGRDGWKFELAQTRKALLAEKGRPNLKLSCGRGKKGLSKVDKPLEHNTRDELAKELRWSTGNLTDGWKFELQRTRKALLLEKGAENLKKPTGSRSRLTLSNVDKVNTREELAKELGWSTGKVAMAIDIDADPRGRSS
jgi:hypothetical protein